VESFCTEIRKTRLRIGSSSRGRPSSAGRRAEIQMKLRSTGATALCKV